MRPILVLVCPCFRQTVIVTCKIVSFIYIYIYIYLCDFLSDNALLKNVIIFIFGKQILKWRSFEKKRLFLTYLSLFLVTREKTQKFLQHISHSHKYTYLAHSIDSFALSILQTYEFIMYGFSLVRLLVLILICAILEQWNNKIARKILIGMSTFNIYLHKYKIYSVL